MSEATLPEGVQGVEAVRHDGRRVIYVSARPDPVRIDVDPDKPWAEWGEPQVFATNLNELLINTEDVEDRRLLVLQRGEEVIGGINAEGFKRLGSNAGFPSDFLMKLPADLASVVANDRIQAAENKQFTILAQDGEFKSMAPGYRELIPYRETAQFVYNALNEVYGDQLQIAEARANGKMSLRILTPIQEVITPAVGDILHAGVEVHQDYADNIRVDLYTNRLVCTNGMTATGSEFEWRQRNSESREHQLHWLRQGLASALNAFANLVNKSRTMAETTFSGNPEDVLREHAAAMRLNRRYVADLVTAFMEEPGNTEWHILNAFTRLATHHPMMDERHRRSLQRAAGDWAADFEIVHARLPRPMAMRVGAEIIEEAEALTPA